MKTSRERIWFLVWMLPLASRWIKYQELSTKLKLPTLSFPSAAEASKATPLNSNWQTRRTFEVFAAFDTEMRKQPDNTHKPVNHKFFPNQKNVLLTVFQLIAVKHLCTFSEVSMEQLFSLCVSSLQWEANPACKLAGLEFPVCVGAAGVSSESHYRDSDL